MSQFPEHNLPLLDALADYDRAVMRLELTRLNQRGAELRYGAAKSDDAAATAIRSLYQAREEESRMRVLVKICRDDAAQWFSSEAPATNTCHGKLAGSRSRSKACRIF